MNKQEYRYFERLVNYIKELFHITVPIYPLDHERFLPHDEGEILGCCHKIRDSDGVTIGYLITIDEGYIKACYNGRQTAYSLYSDYKLIETICHEIAHLYYWNHDSNHEKLTKDMFKITKESLLTKNN